MLVWCLQPESGIGKAGIVTHEYFLSRVAKLLPYVDLEATAAVTEQSLRPAKRRKLNTKSTKVSAGEEELSVAVVDKETNSPSADDNNWECTVYMSVPTLNVDVR